MPTLFVTTRTRNTRHSCPNGSFPGRISVTQMWILTNQSLIRLRNCYERSPRGLIFTWWGCCGLCFWHRPTELAHSILFCSCVYFCLYGPFNCISFHEFSRQLSIFSLCCSGLMFALLVTSTIHLFMKDPSPDVVLCGWLGLKHRLTHSLCSFLGSTALM